MKASNILALALASVLLLQPFLLPSRFTARADDAPPAQVTADNATPADTSAATNPASTPNNATSDTAVADSATTDVGTPAAQTATTSSADQSVTATSSVASSASTTPVTVSTTTATITSDASSTTAVATETPSVGSSLPQLAGTPSISDIPAITMLGTTTPATTTTATSSTPIVSSTTATSTSTATTSTATTTVATTTGPTIQSGQAIALANILNILNTNIVNSVGNAFLLNYVDPVTGTVDLRGGMQVSSTSAICAVFACAGSNGVSVNLASDANIHNALVLSAASGGNEIAHAGDAVINTGNAYAGLNLINLANTNIVDSNYLLVTMNAFQGVKGDVVFPSLSNLLSSLAQNLSPNVGSFSSQGSATVSNNVSTDAITGDNQVSSTTSSTISTGQGISSGNVFNQLNSNLLGGTNVSILFRVQGNWAGQVFGAPQSLRWMQGPNGTIALFNTTGSGQTGSSTQSLSNLSQVTASSTSAIANDINVIALTGQNKVNDAHTAIVTTGTALASANVLNVANTNVVGKNWVLAIINIFGDFTGNIAFGRPDLWVGEQVNAPSGIGNGSVATYKYTIINNGDSVASDVKLTDAYDAAHITVANPSMPLTKSDDGKLVWQLGTIPPGGAVEVTYQGTVQNAQPGANITNTVTATQHETDNNPADNTDTATLSIPQPGGGYFILANNKNAQDLQPVSTASSTVHLSITRTPADASLRGDGSVHQVITLTNDGSAPSIPVSLHDLLHAPDGSVVNDVSWNIGSLAGGEAVQLAYDASFAPNAAIGTYTLASALYDQNGTLLAEFPVNGRISHTPATPLLRDWHALMPSAHARATSQTRTATSTETGVRTLPDVAVANAAANGSQGAAVALLGLSWPYALAIALVLLALAFFVAARRSRTTEADG